MVIRKRKKEKKTPLIIVECKAQNITIREEDYFQGQNYAYFSGAKFFVTTNEKETKYFQVIHGIVPKQLGNEIIGIPKATDLKDNKKIEKLLNATKAFERDEFAKLLFACHNIIRNNDKYSPEMAFDEISKILFIKIWYERRQDRGRIFSLEKFRELKKSNDEIAVENDKPFYQKIFENVKKDYATQDLFDKNDVIKLRENSIESIIQKLEKYNLSDTSDDVKGIAFEEFLGKTFRGELGQFFTPRTLVDFMVEVLDPKEMEIICDPCCGSGGFLIKAFEYVRERIEKEIQQEKEKIKQRYFNKNFEQASEKEKNQITQKVNQLLSKLNEELNPSNQESRLYKLSFWSIYGTDANPRMARTAKMNMIMHGDGHGGVHHNDGLLNINGIFENRFDVILTNPPFGARVAKDQKITEEDKYTDQGKINYYTERYGNEYKQALKQVTENVDQPLLGLYDTGSFSSLTETLFMERCLRLLKPGGRMGIVLPEGVLNNSGGMQKVRNYFEGKAKIILIVSIPQEVFIASGATVKPSLLFLKKLTEKEENQYKTVLKKVSENQENSFKSKYHELNEQIKHWEEKIKIEKDKEKIKPLREGLKKIKKEVQTKKKQLNIEKEAAIRKEVKQKLDYQVPICEIKKAGIDSKGAKIDNHLVPLLEEYTTYRKENDLWQEKNYTINYDFIEDELKRNTLLNKPFAKETKKKSLIFELLKFIPLSELGLWDVKRYLRKQLSFNYPTVTISEVARKNKNPISVENEKKYKRVTVKLKGKGAVLRDIKLGKEIKTKSQFLIKSGQFIFSKIDARNGAFGIVTKALDQSIITNSFSVYDLHEKKIDLSYLQLITSTSYFKKLCEEKSSGTTGRRNISDNDFVSFQIPLPSLPEQQTILERYKQKVKEAERLEKEIGGFEEEYENALFDFLGVSKIPTKYSVSSLNFVNFSNTSRWGCQYLLNYEQSKKLLETIKYPHQLLSNLVSLNPQTNFFNLVHKEKISFLPMECVSDLYGEVIEYRDGDVKSSRGYTKFKQGDLLWSKITPCMQNGKSCIVKNLENSFGYGSTEFHIIREKKDSKIDLQFLYHLLRTKYVLTNATFHFTGSAGQQRVPIEFLANLNIPLPPIDKQNEIVQDLDKMLAERKTKEAKAQSLRQQAIQEFEQTIFSQ